MEDSNTSMGPAVCRICMCGETSIPYLGKQAGEPLISPCRCSGTMGLYHRSCLEHWLTLTKTKHCEICKFAFKITQKSRNFIDYVRQRGYEKQRNDPENRNPFVDLSFIVVITPLACIALYLCIRGAALAGQKYHFAFENRENDENGRNLEIRNETSMEFALFVFVAVVLFFAYTIFISVMFVNHWTQYKKWQTKNMILFVVDQLDAEQSMHYNPQWKHRRSLRSRISRSWKKMRGHPTIVVTPEIVRDAIPIEPIVGISPALVANFNHTSPDSDNTHNHDASRNAIPFGVRSPEQELQVSMSSTPQMYAEMPRKLTLSPIGLDDLFASSPSSSRLHSVSSERRDSRKTQSVYSVSSFGNGVVTCSTPLSTLTHSTSSVSTFKPCPSTENVLANHDDVQSTVTADSQKGRFHVERLETPRF
ncbi:unnamed protein product [Caenorhabditis sp. 36 PRJEB53466]|nr:unnamed protein product [Caenorhabditis sp. 36 PRJEB53466]